MKRIKNFKLFESVEEENENLLNSIIDIFVDLHEDKRWDISFQSGRGFTYEFNDLLLSYKKDSITGFKHSLFRRYEGDSKKTFKILINPRVLLDFNQYSDLLSDLKTEVSRLNDLGFEIYDIDVNRTNDTGIFFIVNITLTFRES